MNGFKDNINMNAAKVETLFMQNILQVDNKFFEMILNTKLL